MYTRCDCIWNIETKGRASSTPTCPIHAPEKRVSIVLPPPSEYPEDAEAQWNTYPFVRVKGEDIIIGAKGEGLYTINQYEARDTAAHLLAAVEWVNK